MLGCHVKSSADQISPTTSSSVVIGRVCIFTGGLLVPGSRSRGRLQDPFFAAYQLAKQSFKPEAESAKQLESWETQRWPLLVSLIVE
jgi:hypothetical protein